MKFFQYDKKVWDDGDVDHTWQFGIVKNTSLLWVNYETPGGICHSFGGINILFSFFGSSLFGVDLQQQTFNFGFHFFTEYFDGWEDEE
jgi:hypothetical protein